MFLLSGILVLLGNRKVPGQQLFGPAEIGADLGSRGVLVLKLDDRRMRISDLAQAAPQRRKVGGAVPRHDQDVLPNGVSQVDVLDQITQRAISATLSAA